MQRLHISLGPPITLNVRLVKRYWTRLFPDEQPYLHNFGAVGLMKFCVFGFGLLQDGDSGVGVFPKG